jgi:hypothetical protein
MTHPYLPPSQRVEKIDVQDGTLIVAAGGFEPRSQEIAFRINQPKKGMALILEYEPHDVRNQTDALHANLSGRVRYVERVVYNRYVPDEFAPRLITVFERLRPDKVVIDISAMSKLAVLLILDVCREYNIDTDVFYCEAAVYGPTRAAFEEAVKKPRYIRPSIDLYTGIYGVVRTVRLSSPAMQGTPTAAIAFMSFNETLTQALINSVLPSRLFLINGRPPEFTWREEATAWIHEALRREWPEADNPINVDRSAVELPLRSTSTLDYRETVRILLDLYWTLASEHRIVVAPTGSKMQTLGVFLAKSIHKDIHIEYPTPKGFLDLYSDGVATVWKTDFGPLGEYTSSLRRHERKRRLGLELPTSSK